MTKLAVRVSDDQLRALKYRAVECGISRSDLIRIAVARLLKDSDVTLPRVERDETRAA